MLVFKHSVHRAAHASEDHQDHPAHQALMVLMVHQAMQEILDHQVTPCQHQMTTSRSSLISAHVNHQRDQRATPDPRDSQEIQEHRAILADQAHRDQRAMQVMPDNLDHQGLRAIPDQQAHPARAHQALAVPMVHPESPARKDLQAHQVTTEHPERMVTTEHQDQTAIRASPAHQDNRVAQVPQVHQVMLVHQALVIIVHLHVSHLDIKQQLANDLLFGMNKDSYNFPGTFFAIVILLNTSPHIHMS